ncbi:hypothetical protein AGABI1DRAFT_130276 [Agaricus bisporus var. burnettii JB137-S8]|uniref:Uncharacterized protein n=1 Tax=Agaricus bisporus var. burnettii (strain JB137-S8 / ATCC MYA-4627 / FGSC 10392) TaxID=597362 RepID=K5XRU1_AGABU|nr:uncharacterized protein AGABI1DRAFT_130276 [Agaricus bisporus var. burnettii JB137-S8]EKM77585.1 hypothetical protein AGABI1DRAFT_130276 [Agaricus bisporus var. burnettii JB137-S8]
MSFVLGNTLIKRNSSGFAIPTFEWRMQWKNTRRPRTPSVFDAITPLRLARLYNVLQMSMTSQQEWESVYAHKGRILFWLYSNANMDPSIQDGGRYHSCHATTNAVVSGLIGEDILLTFPYPSIVPFHWQASPTSASPQFFGLLPGRYFKLVAYRVSYHGRTRTTIERLWPGHHYLHGPHTATFLLD